MVHFRLYTLNYTLDFTLHTLHIDTPTLYTLNCTLYTPQLTPYTLYFTLYTVQLTLYPPHTTFSVHTLHFKLFTFTLCTLLSRPSQLCTYHTLRCIEPCFISMLRAHTYLSSSTSVFSLRYFFPRCQRSTPMRKVDLWIFPNHLSFYSIGYAEFLHPLRATVRTHMFSSSSPPTYIASIHRFGCSP